MQSELFAFSQREQLAVPGLSYLPDFVTEAEEVRLLACVDAGVWQTDLKRRVQHYGFRYDYKAREVTHDAYLGPLPDWLMGYAKKLQAEFFFTPPDQVIINEYFPGQGIAPHIDCVPCFAETIAALSLGSACVMDFVHTGSGEKITRHLASRSLMVFQDEARYRWTHGIAARKNDRINGMTIARTRRVSLTFRKVLQ